MAWCSGSGRSGPLFHVSMAGSYPSTFAVDVVGMVTPPSTHTTPSSTVLATSWRAVGALRTARHGDDGFGAAADGPEVAVAAGVNGRTSAMLVDAPWLGTWAPFRAKTEVPTVATAMPCRGVRIGGRLDHVRLLMSKDSTVGNTAVTLSPPTATRRPPTTAAPRSPRGVGISGSLLHLLADGS